MRFDDSLATVLAADAESANGAAAAWRQLVDLIGRRRAGDQSRALSRLRELRGRVPEAVRRASGRALALAAPPAPLVALFAEDELGTAAPVLRTARLDAAEWLALLPGLTPAGRAVLRHRRDLPGEVMRGLESFGATDFVLAHDTLAPEEPALAFTAPAAAIIESELAVAAEPDPAVAPAPPVEAPPVAAAAPEFPIADLVARLDAFRRDQPAPAAVTPPPPAAAFQFHTDAAGVIRWVEGVARTPLIGVSLAVTEPQGLTTVGPAAAVSLRKRVALRDVDLHIGGHSSAAGRWRLAGEPRFDPADGRFTGIAGVARRASDPPSTSAADLLRTLVHELRTPANAIAGFAELIGSELLGPVPPVYRERAALIQRQGGALTEAIADLDAAARIEGDALETLPEPIDLVAFVADAIAALQPVAQARHCRLAMSPASPMTALADARAARRLVDRLLAACVAAALPGEQLQAQLVAKTRSVRLHVTRPRGMADGDDRLLTIDAGAGSDELLPLGVGFTLRLVRSLADAVGGSLAIAPDRLTLRLPTAVTAEVEQAAQ